VEFKTFTKNYYPDPGNKEILKFDYVTVADEADAGTNTDATSSAQSGHKGVMSLALVIASIATLAGFAALGF
jgi:hypothetical protein